MNVVRFSCKSRQEALSNSINLKLAVTSELTKEVTSTLEQTLNKLKQLW